MRYLIDKDYNLLGAADLEHLFILESLSKQYPNSMIVDTLPKKSDLVKQPEVSGMTTL